MANLSMLKSYLEIQGYYPDLSKVQENWKISVYRCIQGHELEAVKHWGLFLAWIPLEKRTPDLCLAAVRSHPRAIIWVPPALHHIVSWTVIEADPMAIQFIHDPPLELAEAAVRAAPGAAWVLNPRVPEMEALSDQLRRTL